MLESMQRVAVIRGVRTPFAKSGTHYARLTALDLGKMVVTELVERTGVNPAEVQELVFGNVIPSVKAPNIAREIVLGTGLPKKIPGYTVGKACASSNQAITAAADMIARGYADTVIAGGAESLSDIPILFSRKMAEAFTGAAKAKSVTAKLGAFRKVRPKDLAPDAPALAESTTGLSMGESAEKMAKENGISREAQDAWAHRSHFLAAQAWEAGKFRHEVMRLLTGKNFDTVVAEDNVVRKDSKLEAYAKLKPVFDRRYGSVTAGNSSPLTDGAAALVVCSEDRARELGLRPLGFLRAYAYAAVDPAWQLLQAPAFSAPKALKRAGMRLADIDLVEIHEAFAAQVLSNLQAWASKKFADEHLGGAEPIGEVPDEKLNPRGGSIALGHPFGATGARLVHQALRELEEKGKNTALISICAAGGLGAACILERT
jgi:acetyl-CoA acyltransferase